MSLDTNCTFVLQLSDERLVMLNYKNIDRIIARQQARGVPVRWDGWNLVYFKPDPRAEYSRDGHRQIINGEPKWGYEQVLTPNRAGNWVRVE